MSDDDDDEKRIIRDKYPQMFLLYRVFVYLSMEFWKKFQGFQSNRVCLFHLNFIYFLA